jgi:uncharacterized protein YjbJ (UPF0337 family)
MGTPEKFRNKIDRFAGQAKERIGRATGDARMRNEGWADQVRARLRATGERIKDALRRRQR